MKKDLITDILQYLTDNEDARKRFNKQYELTTINRTIEGFDYFNIWLDEESVFEDYEESIHFLLNSLSSPNGKPICGFLEQEILKKSKFTDMINNTGESIECDLLVKVNKAKTLLNTFIEYISNGEGFEKSYKEINKLYNEINL